MHRLIWTIIGALALLWLVNAVGLVPAGRASIAVNWILGTACSLACPLSIFVLLWAPGLIRDMTGGITGYWDRLVTRRREVDNLRQKIAHLDKPHHMVQLGLAYQRQGRSKQASEWFRKALEKDPNSLEARYQLGLCLLAEKRHAEAAELLEQVNSEKPQHDYGMAYLRLAQAHQHVGGHARADEVYATLLRFYPGQPEGSYHYALLKAEQGDLEAARQLMHDLIFSVRNSPGFQRRRNRHWAVKAWWWLKRN